LLSGWVSVGVTGTLAVSVRRTSLALPVGFLMRPVEVIAHVCVSWSSVPVQVTEPLSNVWVVCGRRPGMSALFSGFESTAIISLMPASARSYALAFLPEYSALRAFVDE
jgi:hypothetical protein